MNNVVECRHTRYTRDTRRVGNLIGLWLTLVSVLAVVAWLAGQPPPTGATAGAISGKTSDPGTSRAFLSLDTTTPTPDPSLCGEWRVVGSPLSAQHRHIEAGLALSVNDIWAVGSTIQCTDCDPLGFAMHWTGSSWSSMALPYVHSYEEHYVYSVAAASPNDVWVVGVYGQIPDGYRSLIERWVG